MVLKLAEYVLQVLFGVEIEANQGPLTRRGEVSADWVRKTFDQAPSLPGVNRVGLPNGWTWVNTPL
jgi:hypothetical protein